jgi:hypothetical protein
MTLRIYADFNSCGPGELYWCLRYGPTFRPLDEVAEELRLYEGMSVVLYYEDESEEFEVSAVLTKNNGAGPHWPVTTLRPALDALESAVDIDERDGY